jgi:hypothetical protein
MRPLLSVVLIAVVLVGPTRAQIEKKTSPVTETVRLVSTDMRSLAAPSSYPGHARFRAECELAADGAPAWWLSFYGFVDQTTALNAATTLRLSADGESITPRRIESQTRRLDDSVIEIKRAAFARSSYETLATAEVVTATIGGFKFTLARPLRKDLRLMLDRVPVDSAAGRADLTTE